MQRLTVGEEARAPKHEAWGTRRKCSAKFKPGETSPGLLTEDERRPLTPGASYRKGRVSTEFLRQTWQRAEKRPGPLITAPLFR